MSEIKNGGLDQYGAEPFERQQFGTAGTEGVKAELYLRREAYKVNLWVKTVLKVK